MSEPMTYEAQIEAIISKCGEDLARVRAAQFRAAQAKAWDDHFAGKLAKGIPAIIIEPAPEETP